MVFMVAKLYLLSDILALEFMLKVGNFVSWAFSPPLKKSDETWKLMQDALFDLVQSVKWVQSSPPFWSRFSNLSFGS